MTDVFRKEYRVLTEMEKTAMEVVKNRAGEINDLFNAFEMDFLGKQGQRPMDSRCLALAQTKLEEAVMWFVKGVTG